MNVSTILSLIAYYAFNLCMLWKTYIQTFPKSNNDIYSVIVLSIEEVVKYNILITLIRLEQL